jgi:hypothetical protein
VLPRAASAHTGRVVVAGAVETEDSAGRPGGSAGTGGGADRAPVVVVVAMGVVELDGTVVVVVVVDVGAVVFGEGRVGEVVVVVDPGGDEGLLGGGTGSGEGGAPVADPTGAVVGMIAGDPAVAERFTTLVVGNNAVPASLVSACTE